MAAILLQSKKNIGFLLPLLFFKYLKNVVKLGISYSEQQKRLV